MTLEWRAMGEQCIVMWETPGSYPGGNPILDRSLSKEAWELGFKYSFFAINLSRACYFLKGQEGGCFEQKYKGYSQWRKFRGKGILR